MIDFETSYEKVKKLVEDFKTGEKHYLSQSFNEQEARKYFIDKFFIALGWDVNHDYQKDPSKQEVKIEKTQSNQKRTDYTFFLNPNFKDPKFFVEAKKPSQNLKNADYYFQTIRYGWNATTPIALLTDFEELHILDCRFRPDISYVLNNPNHKQYHYSQYTDKEKFAEIYYLFSREAVLDNSLERYSEALPKPKGKAFQKGLFKGGYQPVDESFLEYLDEVRTSLAKAFKRNDESLTSEQLTEATQRTIDRLVFIRFLEDKLIEQENYVSEFGNSGSSWSDFLSACKKLNAKYNGIVFKKHFIDEQNFAGPELNEFRTICNDICHLNSPYDFNVIPIHILGSIYERFLGKVVHATAKRVTVEEKQEVRKAGGVYYTPKYIVDYIVQNTVGKLIEGKTSEQIAKLRFADIACGSGSFLISVFDCLLLYHNTYYYKTPAKAKKDGCYFKDGLWVLSIQQKQKILLNNIYGVDIDQQATEVTQLSLALKMLEDETTATANDMMVLFHEKILPDMTKNIVCGNSLIGTDILSQNLFAGEEERKLNPMDFETTFPEVFRTKTEKGTMNLPDNVSGDDDLHQAKEPMVGYAKSIKGGFDAIVGNPPYVVVKGGRYTEFEESKMVIDYYKSRYNCLQQQINIYVAFLERTYQVCKTNGLVGLIIPNTILTNDYCIDIRKYLLDRTTIHTLNNEGKVFTGAVVEGLVIIFSNSKAKATDIINTKFINQNNQIKQKLFDTTHDNRFLIHLESTSISIIEKIISSNKKVKDYAEVWRGLTTGNDEKYLNTKKLNKNYKKIVQGKQIHRYNIEEKELYVNYILEELDRPRPQSIFEQNEKIISKFIGKDLEFSYDDKQLFVINTGCVIFLKENSVFQIKYLLGLLNSKVLNYYFKNVFTDYRDVFPIMKSGHIEELPIVSINFKNKTEKAAHDKIVALVEQMLLAKKEVKTAKTDKDITYYQRKCQTLDAQIDAEVYTLYDITPDEINIIDGNAKK
ncbi:MAG TPA: TaqI-like C-terminal specificity domain-containing protein [Bacteroidia bacterium]